MAGCNAKIPKALANDNFISYAHPFIVSENVTWLEATIAAPVFSGLITYYIEGDQSDRHNLMQVAVGNAQKSWGVRGNLFSFLLPWEKVLQELSYTMPHIWEKRIHNLPLHCCGTLHIHSLPTDTTSITNLYTYYNLS